MSSETSSIAQKIDAYTALGFSLDRAYEIAALEHQQQHNLAMAEIEKTLILGMNAAEKQDFYNYSNNIISIFTVVIHDLCVVLF